MIKWTEAKKELPEQNRHCWVLFHGQTKVIFDSYFNNETGWIIPDNFKNYSDPLNQRRPAVKYWAYTELPEDNNDTMVETP